MRAGIWLWAILALALLAGGCGKKRGYSTEHTLWSAAYRGDVAQVQSLIVRGLSVHDMNRALSVAAEQGHVEVVQLLVRCGARIDCQDDRGQRPIMLALAENQREVVEYLVDEGAAVNLQVAAYLGDAAKVKELIDSGAADPKGREGDAAMSYAVTHGQRDVAEVLIRAGVNLGEGGADGDTPLHDAVRSNRLWMAELLIDSGADLNAGREDGTTPLYRAVREGNLDMIKLLIAKGADINTRHKGRLILHGSPLGVAIDRGHIDVAELLVAAGADVGARDASGWTPLHIAVTSYYETSVNALMPAARPELGAAQEDWDRYGAARDQIRETLTVRTVGLLVAHGADVNAGDEGGVTPLHLVARDGRKRIVELLIAHGALVNAQDDWGSTPLYCAVRAGNEELVELLLEKGGDVNARDKEGATPLVIALSNGDVEIAMCLFAAGAHRVVLKDWAEKARRYGPPVLHRAIGSRHVTHMVGQGDDLAVVGPGEGDQDRGERWLQLLLENGADPNEWDEQGNTPLQAAILAGNEASARLLVAHGADVKAQNRAGSTALHYASSEGRKELVSLLLAKGADVNGRADDGDTPLHNAALRGRRDVVEVLLAHGADPGVANSRGRTPLDEAVRHGHGEVVQLLTDRHGRGR